ncbi:MAG TPA: type I methionyl aminopeptidase, partial [Candidatus Saccharimonadales bacterium]|nr:type I methionyl aminopeptidase [Candidatus Saccharimonadales bacterium]
VEQTAGEGMTGKDVSALCRQELQGFGAIASFLGYQGFPDVICISVNHAVVHGIPNERSFKPGDIIGFDFGVTYKGMITDSALSLCIGQPNNQQKTLLQQTERAMYAGIEQVKNGVRTGDIGAAVEKILSAAKLGIVRDLVGHGVGHAVHEDPNIPNYGPAGKGPTLKAGMTIAIEPMATLGGDDVVVDRDGWTVLTADHTLAAHFEHTVLVTQDGYEVLTERA